jgi:hypothetical protein
MSEQAYKWRAIASLIIFCLTPFLFFAAMSKVHWLAEVGLLGLVSGIVEIGIWLTNKPNEPTS